MAIKMQAAYTQTKDSNSSEVVSEDLKQNVYTILQSQPLSFIENRGQIDSRVKYYAKGNGYTFYFTPNEIKFSFIQKKSMNNLSKSLEINSFDEGTGEDKKEDFMSVTVGLKFIDINSELIIETQNKLKSTVNYFKGNVPTKWQTQIPTFEKIIYKEIWNGIDLVFYGENSKLKYDFIVQPRALVEDIKFTFDGYDEKFIDENGNLIIKTPLGELIDEKPICYQEVEGAKVMIESEFITNKKDHLTIYGYKMQDKYDKKHPIIIDPGIIYSSYLGGTNFDIGNEIAVDQNGNVYLTGETQSTDFPTVNAFQPSIGGFSDAFIAKINSTPSIVYSSYLGGNGIDRGFGIAVDQNGNAYVTGVTSSNNFPTVNAFQSSIGGSGDAFITKIDSSPAIVYSSYLGGSGLDIGNGIAVDQNGNAYLTGITRSTDFPIANAFQPSSGGSDDAFVTKVDSTPSIVYSSYLGGSGDDVGNGIAVDQNGNVYLTGSTRSSNFPIMNAFQSTFGGGTSDAFVAKIDSSPAIVYSSYLGGSGTDIGNGIAVDQNGNAYLTGSTSSSNFPIMNAFQSSMVAVGIDAFVTKIDSTPSIVYSSFLGGSGNDQGFSIAVDQNGNVYVTGFTSSGNFPIMNAFQPSSGGLDDAFVTKVDSTPSIVYSSYLGGSGDDIGLGITVDQNGNVYVTGQTFSANFPTVNPFQSTIGGSSDAFVTKIGGPLLLTVNAANLSAVVFD